MFFPVFVNSSVWAERGNWDQSTPKKAWISFRDACRSSDFISAARLFSTKATETDQKNAARLCRVLDSSQHTVSVDLLSDEPVLGKTNKTEELITYILGSTKPEDRLVLTYRENEKLWFVKIFSEKSLERWFTTIKEQDRFIEENFPDWMYTKKRLGLYIWQWFALPLLLMFSLVTGFFIVLVLRVLLHPFLRRKNEFWNPDLIKRVRGPVRLLFASVLAQFFLPFLNLAQEMNNRISKILIIISIWMGIGVGNRMVRLCREGLQFSTWIQSHPSALTLLPLGTQFLRVILIIFGIMLTLHTLEFSITSLLAGVGLGGLAVALAAQKTVEQVLGGIILSVDQPIRVGDLIKVGDFIGTVEFIGLRSSRIRTLDRTVLVIPNGKLAEMNIENFSLRDRMRLLQVMKIDYCTSTELLQNLLEEMKFLIQENPRVIASETTIHLRSFGDCSFEIEVVVYFQTTDLNEFNQLRQNLLLQLAQTVEKERSAWGLPSRSVQTNSAKGAPVEP